MSTLVFFPNIPTGGQTVASTTVPIQTNFASLDSAFDNPVGGVTGGGNFCSYSLQATTTSFTAKPVDPIGVLYTTTSGSGHPELAYINNVNSVGAGPYTGTQLTGGGVTAAVWGYWDGAVLRSNYNIKAVTSIGGGQYKVEFIRPFANLFYNLMVMPETLGAASNASGVGFVDRSMATQVIFTVRNQVGGIGPFPFNIVMFGILS